MNNHTATYSPEDDKIRIYPAYRLPADEYAELKAAGYGWAPKQECFYAVWTPHREATALQFAEEIGDEDTSLVDRAEQRAERFENYSDNRAADSERAHKAVAAIADNIPFGQPILVGHHSEKRARKDAQRIENGMRHAVKMWDTAQYWTRRAAGALANAKYKERPDVRARRIKTIEADKRKQERNKTEVEKWLKAWNTPDLTLKQARQIANYCNLNVTPYADRDGFWSAYNVLQDDENRYKACPAGTVQDCINAANRSYPRTIRHCETWIQHYDNRLAYERAMLQEAGGTAADKFNIEVGGTVLVRGEWCTVLRVNRTGGVINSVTTNRRYVSKVGIETVADYRPPTAEQTAAVKSVMTKAPICNYPAESILCKNGYHAGQLDEYGPTREITKTEWTAKCADYKGTKDVPATETTAAHRVRIMLVPGGSYKAVYITDEKRKDPPAPTAEPAATLPPVVRDIAAPRPTYTPRTDSTPEHITAMQSSLKAGVQTVTAPQLFPTPPTIAAQMVELADIQPGMTVLEPSAGTGNILDAIMNQWEGLPVVVEINPALCEQLRIKYPLTNVMCTDFLTFSRGNYPVDRIIMNPPFENGSDIKHIKHALTMLKPGGRLVALCAAGSRQTDQLKPLADQWEVLPAGSFKEQGTNVNVALMVITNQEDAPC